MLAIIMLNWIHHDIGSTHIVIIEVHRIVIVNPKSHSLVEPKFLCNDITNNTIFSFSGGLRHHGLILGALGNVVGSQIHCITSDRMTRILTACLIYIKISNNDRHISKRIKEETMVNSAL